MNADEHGLGVIISASLNKKILYPRVSAKIRVPFYVFFSSIQHRKSHIPMACSPTPIAPTNQTNKTNSTN